MMTAAEWRKRLRIRPEWPPEFDALLRDFEAAEAENERLRGEANRKHYERRHRKRNLQALMRLWRAWDGALDAIHRLEDRCVAAEEERNAYERQLLAVKACDGETAKAVAAEARAQAAEAADMDHQAWWLEEKATRELAEARANTLEARLLDLESQIGNTTALAPQAVFADTAAALRPVERGEEGVPGADVCCHGIAIDEYCDFCHGGEPQAGEKEGV